jgi:hypothetical protein
LSLALPAATRADVRVGVGIRFDAGYHDVAAAWRYGYNRGIDEGYREGERDARRHERFGYRDEHAYRDSDRGYKGWMGPRYEYERGYRRGFEEAYARAYQRYDRHDRYDRDEGRDRW